MLLCFPLSACLSFIIVLAVKTGFMRACLPPLPRIFEEIFVRGLSPRTKISSKIRGRGGKHARINPVFTARTMIKERQALSGKHSSIERVQEREERHEPYFCEERAYY